MRDQSDLGEFLQARRRRVQPEAVGIAAVGRRRVSGLRREEIAALAGVSLDYYVRLEQGRALNPSDGVLDAIGRALALDETELIHLRRLGRAGPKRKRVSRPLEVARPGIARLLETLDWVPAYLLGRRLDLIAWSAVGSVLLGDFAARPARERNLARLVFLDPAMRKLFPEWERVACETVGLLQLAAGRNPHDPDIEALVEELSLKDASFRSLWVDHDVAEVTSGDRRFQHPVVGDLTLRFEVMVASDDCSQTLVTYTADAGSSADTALKLLATWAASTGPAAHSASHRR